MESSFTKGYDKKVAPDGSIELNFETLRFGAHSGLGVILLLVMLPASCAVTSPVVIIFNDAHASRQSFQSGIMALWIVCTFALWFFSVYKLQRVQSVLKIKPAEGVIFLGSQLPFADIQAIGTYNETTTNNAKGTAYVFANSHGRQIKLTKYMPLELAEAIANEIKQASGCTWS